MEKKRFEPGVPGEGGSREAAAQRGCGGAALPRRRRGLASLSLFGWGQGTVNVAKSMIRELVEKAAAIKVQCCGVVLLKAPIHEAFWTRNKVEGGKRWSQYAILVE